MNACEDIQLANDFAFDEGEMFFVIPIIFIRAQLKLTIVGGDARAHQTTNDQPGFSLCR
jgi:hypothetical protein